MKGKGVAVVIVLMFALALGAGAALGKLLFRSPQHPNPVAVRGTLSDELQLTPAQRSQMQQIWLEVSKLSNECIDETKNIQTDEDNELLDHILTTPEQKEQFQALRNRSKAKLDALAKKRDSAFNAAVDKTRTILNDEQRRTYNQILNDRVGTQAGASQGPTLWDSAQALR